MSRGYVYAKGKRLYIAWYDAKGDRHLEASGYAVGQEAQAEKKLEIYRADVEADRAAGGTSGPVTVAAWGATWIERRKSRGIKTVGDDEARLRDHVLPTLGALPLADVRPRQVRAWLHALRAGELAPRTVRHVYGVLRAMMAEAVADELIPATPCALLPGDLPAKDDADPTWRSGAVFTRSEIEALISDERIPADRRVVYALLALAGLRWGEMAALRWRDYDASAKPLGRLTVAQSYSTRRKTVGETKTATVRLVPVHPALAAVLAMGRGDAGPDDLIAPSRLGVERSVNHGLRRLHQDLERLGLRPRRAHDLRRSFVSLARGAGASKDQVAWITHTPRGADVIDGYTTLEWAALCGVVQAIQIGLRTGQVVELRAAASATALLPLEPEKKKAPKSLRKSGPPVAGCTGLEPVPTPDRDQAKSGVGAMKTRENDVPDDLTDGTDSARSGASGSNAATDPETTVRAALATLPRPDAAALLSRILAELLG